MESLNEAVGYKKNTGYGCEWYGGMVRFDVIERVGPNISVHILLPDISVIHYPHCDDLNSEGRGDAMLTDSWLHVCQVSWLQRTLGSSRFMSSS